MQPLRHAFRRIARAPGFTALVLATLALGIGSTTAIFGVLNGILIKPLPYPASQELVSVWHLAPGVTSITGNINCSPGMYFTYREENQTFENFGLWNSGGASITGLAEPEQVRVGFFTAGVLDSLNIQPTAGRWFTLADDTPGSPETVILMHGYWQRRFGGDPTAVGRTLTVDARPRTIIGVMGENFRFTNDPDMLLPQRFDRGKVFLGNFSHQCLARLKAGVTLEQANADVARMLPIWLKTWPLIPGMSRSLFENARFGPKVQPLKDDVVGTIGTVLWVLMGTVGLVLLIAAANVANLLLVRAEGRQQELIIRAALGAGWRRIARDMLLESAVLGLLGGALGLGLAYVGLRVLVAAGPATLPRLQDIGIDPLVLAFALGVSLFAGLLSGVIPVVKYSGARVLSGTARTHSHTRERHRARNTLVVVQVALALILLVGSGLMIRTFLKLRDVQPGFTAPQQVQLLRIFIPDGRIQNPEQVMRAQQAILDKLAAIPGVTAAGFSSGAPLEGFNSNDILYAEDRTYDPGQIPPIRRFRSVTPGYFQTTGTPLIAGRDYQWNDLYDQRDVVIVSAGLAREMWGDPASALGKRVRQAPASRWREIIGVVGDVYDNGVHLPAPAMVYWPAMLRDYYEPGTRVTRGGVLLVRTERAGTESFLAEARQAVWAVDGNLPVFLVRTLEDLYRASMARTSFTLVMLAIAGGMALILGVVGIYGVIAYAVTQRTREIGIRMALGAEQSMVKGMFVRHGLLLAAIGAGIGLGAAAGLTRLMSSLLFGVRALDPWTYSGVALFLLGAAALASYIPARRATRIDPVEALRAE